jgi:predicted HicB family RNase H-like nuclease
VTTKNKQSLRVSTLKQRITLFINPSIVKQAKAQAVFEEISLADLIEKALSNYLPNETVIKKAETGVDFNP